MYILKVCDGERKEKVTLPFLGRLGGKIHDDIYSSKDTCSF